MKLFSARTLRLAVATVALLGAGLSTPPALAQEEGEQKTKQTVAMSKDVYEALAKAQELIENKQIDQGMAALRKVETKPKLSPYEKANIYNFMAYAFYLQEKYQSAITSYEKVLQQPDLPEGMKINTLYTLAQLYFTIENYKKAVATIEKWMKVVDKPTETAYLLLGQAYYQLKDYKKALEPIKKGIDLVKARGEVPKENLYLLLRVNYFELGDYKNMARVMRELISHYPKKEYWLTLAGAYSELNQLKKQMAILEMLYDSGELEQGAQQLNLANLYMLHEAPYKAAKLLEKTMNEGKIEENIRNLRLLSQAYVLAQETDASIPPLIKAANKSSDGELEIRLANSYLNLDRYDEAVEAIRRGLKKGGVKRPDQANIMMGLALFEQKKYQSARRAFVAAKSDRRSTATAEQWISYINTEIERRAALQGDALLEKAKEDAAAEQAEEQST